MPLPTGDVTWPPADLTQISRKYAEFDAWYSGDPTRLRAVYQRGGHTAPVDRVAQHRGGVSGALARFWWGRPVGDLTRRQDWLHVPLAADICQASADLLLSEPPDLTHPDTAVQERIDLYADNGLHTLLAEAAEVTAALGDSYLRTTWAEDSGRNHAFLTVVDADQAHPEFRWGHLNAVTFWWELHHDGQTVWRHLERHELDPRGYGIIFHGLYEGTIDKLGRQVPLTEHPSTAGLQVNADGYVDTGSAGLAVQHLPNQTPQRLLRRHPVGRHLGRSDLAGVEPELDALDETYSSWMRDIRLGKGRVIAPQHMLESAGRGRGAMLDLDQDVFVGVNEPPGDGQSIGLTINQFAIRVEEHARTCSELVATILRSSGYSGHTFGEGESGGVRTATEVVSEESRSYRTRDRKIRLLAPRIKAALAKTLAVDSVVYGPRLNLTEDPKVQFGDAVQSDPEALARTSQALRTAQAASTETLVRMNHPDWDETAVKDEVSKIQGENAIAVPSFGLPAGGDDSPAVDDES